VVGSLPRKALAEMLALTEILLPNEAELLALAGSDSLATAIAEVGKSVACLAVKRGGRGSLIMTDGGEPFECPAVAVDAVDTTGAGDAFNAGVLAALMYDLEPQAWGDWGNRLAARVVAKRGAGL
jgi:sugar/nucleoside kinase (ribokinase family)